jgi:hypothetical protein
MSCEKKEEEKERRGRDEKSGGDDFDGMIETIRVK